MADTWKDIAILLGERMSHQANTCASGYGQWGEVVDPEAVHANPEEHAESCANCADTVAFRRYVAKLRRTR